MPPDPNRNLLNLVSAGPKTPASRPGTPTPGAQQPQAGDREIVQIGDRIIVLQFRPFTGTDAFGQDEGAGEWVELDSFTQRAGSTSAGSGISNQVALGGLEVDWAQIGIEKEQLGINKLLAAETTRSNKAREAEDRRQRALSASSTAIQAYLTGTQLADARKLNAFQEARALLPSLVAPGREFFAGQEPGGTLATAAERFNLPFAGAEVVTKALTPASLALPPTKRQIGSEIVRGVEDVRAKGR